MSLTSLIKGWIGETMGAAAHWAFLDKTVYHSLNNVTLQTSNGTTQIDHVLVSRYGIFVIEAKNIDGWIFGDAKSSQWTVANHGRKYRMQNPLHQNYRHVRAILDFLTIEEDKIHSLVMFWGECTFKTAMPENVLSQGYSSYIKRFNTVVFSDQEVMAMLDALQKGALPKSWQTRKTHLASLQSRHASTTVCARCGSALVLRTVKSGAKAGSQFYGCSSFPKCRHTLPIAPDRNVHL